MKLNVILKIVAIIFLVVAGFYIVNIIIKDYQMDKCIEKGIEFMKENKQTISNENLDTIIDLCKYQSKLLLDNAEIN